MLKVFKDLVAFSAELQPLPFPEANFQEPQAAEALNRFQLSSP